MVRNFLIFITRDDEANVYCASSDDIEGFVTEADTIDELMNKSLVLAGELLLLNNQLKEGDQFKLSFSMERVYNYAVV